MGNATKINPSDLPDFDLLVGGFPCQAFSIAGKRRGFDDTRGTLFFDVARILKEKRPRNFILENVKGLLSHDFGRTFKTIISALAELGYGVEWQVLNAKNFGVPQNRERVFIVGHLGGFGGRQIFPVGEDDEIHPKENGSDQASNQSTVGPLRSQGDKAMIRVNRSQDGKVSPADGVSFTLSAGHYNQPKVEDGLKIRRLTPIECERLMGLPDNWTEGISDTQRYKCCGNGIVVNVVCEVVRRLYVQN